MSKPKDKIKCLDKLKEFIIELFFGFIGNILVFSISNYGEIHPVIVVASLALCVTIIIPKRFMFVFFASALSGIMVVETFGHFAFILISGTLVTIITKLTEGIFKDIGGKPGTIAFISNGITLTIAYLISLSGAFNYDIMKIVYSSAYYYNLNIWVYIFAPFFSTLAAYSVHLFSEAKGIHVLRLTIYGVVCLFGSLMLSIFRLPFFTLENNTVMYYGNYFITYWHVGSLVGLSIKEKYKHFIEDLYFFHYLIAGYLAGWLAILVSPIMLIGGKHGFIAFIANNIYMLIVHLIFKVLKFENTPADIIMAEGIHKEDKKLRKLKKLDILQGIEERRPISMQFTGFNQMRLNPVTLETENIKLTSPSRRMSL